MNLIDALQQHFGYDPLKKIDPNTQDVKQDGDIPTKHRFSQAAIPVILTGIRTYSSTDDGAQEIVSTQNSTNWVNILFKDNAALVVEKVAVYGGHSPENTFSKLKEIAATAVSLIQQAVAPGNKIIDVKNLMESQINSVLTYLPASLQLGQLLNENTIDDRTNKMEGPLSSLINSIGAAFSNADDDVKKERP